MKRTMVGAIMAGAVLRTPTRVVVDWREITMKVTRLALAATLTVLASCGDDLNGPGTNGPGTISVSGRITWNGEPVSTTVSLWHRKSGTYGGPILRTLASVNTNADGTYALDGQVEECSSVFDGRAWLKVVRIGPTSVPEFPLDSALGCGQHIVNFFWTSEM